MLWWDGVEVSQPYEPVWIDDMMVTRSRMYLS